MRPAHRVDYGRFVPVCLFFVQQAWDISPVASQIDEQLLSSIRLMTAEPADKIRSPQPISPGSQPKLQDEELISPEETLRKFIESY